MLISAQLFDKDFNEYVDLLEEDPICDMSVVRVVKPPSGAGITKEVVACTSQPTTSKEMEAADNSSVQNFSNVISSEDDDGRDFTLPDLGILHDAVTGNNPLGSYATTRIVDVLFQEMTRFTLYPSKQFYRKVGTALVQRHHELADTCGSGHDSWVMLIRQKFKNERRKLETDRVCANRLKFGSSGKQPRAAVDTASMELQRGKVGAALSQDLAPSGEDEYSLAQHEAWLVTEWTKSNPDRQQMCCRLELTHSARVKDLCKLSIAEAIDKYPYLRDIEWFLEDFKQLLKKDGNEAVEAAFSKVVELALSGDLGATKKDLKPLLEADQPGTGARRKKHVQAVRVLELLARVLKQPRATHMMFLPSEAEMPLTPCIVFSGPSFKEAEALFLYIEKRRLLRVIDAVEGTTAIMAAHWMFNLRYNRKAFNICCVLEHLFLGVSISRPRSVAQRFIAKHKSSFTA
ncbi:uncharacterized protein LOC115332616 [Ixodes scapularis]|uniref:uncharacterized protein LOC115332616 n=1 Tax=Ixodes scapularis TaxID=6945 RepID=UPI001C385AAB|nr:uncharacterized protein LOC115332616 [Ixodes scapularis]